MKNKKFELAKPMNMVQMSWSKGMTVMQIKTIHVLTVKLKKWILDTNFKPNGDIEGVDAYQGIKTSFEMSLSEFAGMINTSSRALKTQVKDKEGNKVLLKNFPKLRVMEYFEEVKKVNCIINSSYISGVFTPIAAAVYDKETEMVRLGTTMEMAAVLQDEAFSKNLSFVDMQLQLSLNSVMASHILDRISRFKELKYSYKCSVGELIDQCGIDDESIKNRRTFINVNITRPLMQIEEKSGGVWVRVGSGATVTSKKRGTLLRSDEITFTMQYHKPRSERKKAKDQVSHLYMQLMTESVDKIDLTGVTKELIAKVVQFETTQNNSEEATENFEDFVYDLQKRLRRESKK